MADNLSYVNRFTVTMNPAVTQIQFTEKKPDSEESKAALIMSTTDAKELSDLLIDLLEKTIDQQSR